MLHEELAKSKNQKAMQIKPIRMYVEEENINYNDINEGDLIIATVYQFISPNTIYLCVGEINAEMDLTNFYYYPDDNSNDKLIKSVYNSIGKKVIARVKEKKDGQLILERSSVIKETSEFFSQNIGIVVDATIETISPFGIFVDIGNGFISLLHHTEISKSRIYNFENVFEIGERIKVKIIDYNFEKCMAHISRKQAYKLLSENELPIGSAVVANCRGYVNDELDGVFVEYDPNNVGIMNMPEGYSDEFYDGRKIIVIIKLHKEKGFKANFVRFI